MDFNLAVPRADPRTRPEVVVGVVPANAISALRATRAGTYLTEISLPGSHFGGVNSYSGEHWARAMGEPVQFQQENVTSDPVMGVDLSADANAVHAQIRALARAAATAAVYMTNTPRESVQVELVSGIQTPDRADLNIVFPIITPFVTSVRDPSRAIEPDLTRAQARDFLAGELARLLREKISRYGKREGWFAAIDRVIVRRQTPPRVGRGGASLVGRSLEAGSRVWVAYNPKTRSQCLYQSLCVGRSYARPPKRDRTGNRIPYKFTELFSRTKASQQLWQNSTSSFRDQLKRRCVETSTPWEGDGYAGFQTINIFSQVYQTPVKVYTSALLHKQTFTPDPDSPLRLQRIPKLPPLSDCIELLFTGSHYLVLLRRRSLTAVFGDWEAEAAKFEHGSALRFLDAHADGLRPYRLDADPNVAKLPSHFVRPDGADEAPLSKPLKVPAYTRAEKYTSAHDQALKMITWDTETFPREGKCCLYATGVSWYEETPEGELEPHHRIWRGEDSTCDMLVWLGSAEQLPLDRVNGSFLIAHNSAKFDVAMLATSVALSTRQPWSLDCSSFVENNSRWITGRLNMKQSFINHAGTQKLRSVNVTLRDSFCLLPGSLARLAKDLNVGGAQKLDLPHDRIFGGEPAPEKPDPVPSEGPLHWSWLWEDGWDGKPETWGVYSYLKNDCVALLEIMNKFNASIFSEFKFGALQCPTAASISKRIFLSNFLASPNDMHVCADELERVIRCGFLGGRVECFRQGLVEGPIYYYDFTYVH